MRSRFWTGAGSKSSKESVDLDLAEMGDVSEVLSKSDRNRLKSLGELRSVVAGGDMASRDTVLVGKDETAELMLGLGVLNGAEMGVGVSL